MTSPLDSIDWYGFLERAPLAPPTPKIISSLAESTILITGAGGSIGGALALRLAGAGAQLILLESSESSLYELHRRFTELQLLPRADFYLGSAADQSVLDEIFLLHGPRLVFHAAAYKHVPLLEDQPFATIENNIFTTETLAAAATLNHARVVLLSTDKAVAPASIMGATKRVAEQIVLSSQFVGQTALWGTVVRLGNVLATRGSVTEVFARQIAAGLPLTVTDPAARRYFLTIDEAVDLILCAAEQPPPALLAPQLPVPHFIADLARYMARCLEPDRQTSVEFTSLRAGDKETEHLWSISETPHPANSNSLVSIDSPPIVPSKLRSSLIALHSAADSRDRSAAINALRLLVPDYSPSSTLLKCIDTATPQVADE